MEHIYCKKFYLFFCKLMDFGLFFDFNFFTLEECCLNNFWGFGFWGFYFLNCQRSSIFACFFV